MAEQIREFIPFLRVFIWKSDLTGKMKRSFFQAAVVSILLYGCTTWTLTKRMEKKLDGNDRRMLQAVLNKSWRQHPTKQQLYGNLPPITKTIKSRRTRHVWHYWRSRGELISDVLLWTPSHGRPKAERPARTNMQQLCVDTGCSSEDLPEPINDREGWRDRVRDIRADGTKRWWMNGIHPKGNEIAKLDVKLCYYDVAVKHVIHYAISVSFISVLWTFKTSCLLSSPPQMLRLKSWNLVYRMQ